ncbi:MAG: hypothetical protein WD595_06535 [Waddliaceae bacterium]
MEVINFTSAVKNYWNPTHCSNTNLVRASYFTVIAPLIMLILTGAVLSYEGVRSLVNRIRRLTDLSTEPRAVADRIDPCANIILIGNGKAEQVGEQGEQLEGEGEQVSELGELEDDDQPGLVQNDQQMENQYRLQDDDQPGLVQNGQQMQNQHKLEDNDQPGLVQNAQQMENQHRFEDDDQPNLVQNDQLPQPILNDDLDFEVENKAISLPDPAQKMESSVKFQRRKVKKLSICNRLTNSVINWLWRGFE